VVRIYLHQNLSLKRLKEVHSKMLPVDGCRVSMPIISGISVMLMFFYGELKWLLLKMMFPRHWIWLIRFVQSAANDKVMGKVKVLQLPASFYPWGNSAPGTSGMI
jgi:hypothetical protein